jgi:DNA-binding NarL/FixJ family response regulator
MIAARAFPSSPHIMLVDDHPIVRRGVRDILSDAFPAALIEEVSLGADAILLLQHVRWDVVILDVTLPDGSGLDVLERIRELKAGLPVLILSMHSADQFARRALRAGASGYLTKDVADTELVTAVTHVVAGRTYLSTPTELTVGTLGGGTVGAGRSRPVAADSEPPHARLSARERQVLLGIAQGKTVGAIAEELMVGCKSVSTYRTRLLKKLSMRTNAEIMRYVMEHRLVHQGPRREKP